MKLKTALQELEIHSDISTLFSKLQLLHDVTKANASPLVAAYFHRIVTLENLQKVEFHCVKFLKESHSWKWMSTQRLLHKINTVQVEYSYSDKCKWISTTNGYILNRTKTDLPVGKYILLGDTLYFWSSNTDEFYSLFPLVSHLKCQGKIKDFPLVDGVYNVNGVRISNNYIFNPNWYIFTNGTKPAVLSETDKIGKGSYSMIQPQGYQR